MVQEDGGVYFGLRKTPSKVKETEDQKEKDDLDLSRRSPLSHFERPQGYIHQPPHILP